MLTAGFQYNFRPSISFPEPKGRLVSTKTRELRVLALTKRHVGSRDCSALVALKGWYTRGSLLPQHAPGEKLPRVHQQFLAKKYVPQHNFCSWVLLPLIKLVWYEGASSRGKSVARVCFRSKLPRVYWNVLAVKWRVSSLPIKLAYFFHPQLIANSVSKWRPKK